MSEEIARDTPPSRLDKTFLFFRFLLASFVCPDPPDLTGAESGGVGETKQEEPGKLMDSGRDEESVEPFEGAVDEERERIPLAFAGIRPIDLLAGNVSVVPGDIFVNRAPDRLV